MVQGTAAVFSFVNNNNNNNNIKETMIFAKTQNVVAN
jgi:hypothetical protein